MSEQTEAVDLELAYPYAADEFAGAVLADLRARGYAAARFDEAGLVVHSDEVSGTDRRLLFDRPYFELQELPEGARAAHLEGRVDAALRPSPATWADAQPMLRSMLRPTSFTAAVTAPDDRPWIRPLWPFVHEVAVVDTGAARAVVTEADTARWGVSGEQMFAVARANIAARYPPQPQPEGIGHLRGDGHSYCDSAVLVPGWLSSFAGGPDDPAPLVFFPGDEVLLVCTDDPDIAPAFFAAAERIYRQAAVPISPQGYTIVGPDIVALDSVGRGRGAALRAMAVRARSVLAESEYSVQTRRLQRYLAHQEIDTSVGEVQVIETPRGSCTMTVWTQGTPGLLPVADYVTLLPTDQAGYFTTPFPVLVDVLGLTRDPNLLPRRYPVTEWPSPAELSVLREHAVTLPGI